MGFFYLHFFSGACNIPSLAILSGFFASFTFQPPPPEFCVSPLSAVSLC